MSQIDFTKLGLPVSKNISIYTPSQQQLIYNYLEQLDDTHKQTYLIAIEHLGTSFNVIKSNGYKEWINKMDK
jgi:hypothetical protein